MTTPYMQRKAEEARLNSIMREMAAAELNEQGKVGDSDEAALRQMILAEIGRKEQKKQEREEGAHEILKRLGFTISSLQAREDDQANISGVVLGSIVHNELTKIAKARSRLPVEEMERMSPFTLVVVTKLAQLGIILDRANVDVWDSNPFFLFATKIDLMGTADPGTGEKVKIMIELKTTKAYSTDATFQINHHTGRNEFPDDHPLKKTMVYNNTLTKALTQLFLMYRNYRKVMPDVRPYLIYVFADDVRIFPLFELIPSLRPEYFQVYDAEGNASIGMVDHVEQVYQDVVVWYALRYSRALFPVGTQDIGL